MFSEPLSRIALFLDFDGTLVAIADRPDAVRVTPEIAALLPRLTGTTNGATAIISGRALAEIDAFLAPLTLPAAGSHGVERRRASGDIVPPPGANDALDAAVSRIRDHARRHDLLMEDKGGGAAIHFRAQPALEAETRALVDGAADAPGLRAIHGHMVAELSLEGLDKGAALAAFMDEPPFAGRIPVAIGDDTTDEDAFRAAQSRGGLGIRIGLADTAARASFDTIDLFHRWLADTADSGTLRLETP